MLRAINLTHICLESTTCKNLLTVACLCRGESEVKIIMKVHDREVILARCTGQWLVNYICD
jgi:hypothetical protein